MTSDVLHIVFTSTGAASLRNVLNAEQRNERVVCLFDDFSFGPIDPPDPDVRKAWVEAELGFTGWPTTPDGSFPWARTESVDVSWDELGSATREFWSEALSAKTRKIVWMTRRSAMEYAGFLEWLWRAGDTPCDIVDLSECKISRRSQHGPPTPPALAISLGGLFPDEIRDNKLFDRGEPLQASVRHHYRELWRRLRADNAPLRVTNGQDLVSAPLSFFDRTLLAHMKDNWRKVALIVGLSLGDQMDERLYQAGDMVLAARINALVNSGMLEFQGVTPFAMRFSEVRLRIASPPTATTG